MRVLRFLSSVSLTALCLAGGVAGCDDRATSAAAGGTGASAAGSDAAAPPRPATATAVDPVCQMPTGAGPAAPRVEFGGRTYFFCSDDCRAQFLHDPRRYTAGPSTRP